MAKAPPVYVSDGHDEAQGTTTDAAWVSGPGTVISLLKKIASAGGGGGGGPVTIADGADVAQGTTTDASSANTVIGLLKAIKAAVQGTLGISGTVTANAGTNLNTSALALDATLTGGTQRAIVRGGAKGTTGAADVTSTPIDANRQALLVDGSAVTQPVSGTVTADTELPAASALADTDSNPTTSRIGSNGLLWNGTSWDRAPGDKTNGAKVQSAQLPAALDGSGFLKTHEQGTALSDVTDRAARLLGVVDKGKIWDGTNIAAVKAASAAVAATDPALVVAVSPNADTKVNVDQYGGSAVTLGQKAMASSEPVVIASDQSAVPVKGDVANASADSGNPVKTGGLATFPGIPTLVATGQRVNQFLDLAGAVFIRKRPLATYSAIFRLADATAGQRYTTFAYTANTDKQLATIYHPNTAVKRVQIKYVALWIASNTAGATLEFELQPLSATTAPATGNPAITPGKHDQADAAAEATCLLLPTTAGSLVGVNSPVGLMTLHPTGIIAVDTNPRVGPPIVLWDSRGDTDGKDLIIRAGAAEGYAVNGRANAATTIGFIVEIIFTEE